MTSPLDLSTAVTPFLQFLEQSCNEGLIVPLWRPVHGYSTGEMYLRAFVYFFALLYLFLGVSIVADRFMAAIETITSQEKEILVKRKNGEKVAITIRVWNETVSNLTLMALGSSAPEILLSIIEVCHKDFRAGDLGPNTIVGSAAFNLLIIIAICIVAVPNDEIRRQRYLRVFLVTATWSIFAYIWLYLIISVFSVGVIEIWEAFLTFLFFPITVITAYVADRKLIDYRFLTKRYRRSTKNTDGIILDLKPDELQPCMLEKAIQEADDDSKTPNLTSKELKEYEETRKQFGEILKKLKVENPNADSQFLQREAEYHMMMKARKSRAFYRIQNGQKICGGGNFIKKRLIKQREGSMKRKNSPKCMDLESATPACKIYFNPPYYTVMENEGFLEVTVTCEGQLPDDSCLKVDYFTIDGTAQAESDYVAVSGCLVFLSSDVQRHKRIKVAIIDDDIFEEDEHFYVCLSNPRIEYDQTSPKNQ
uniref:Calx-beta domain-containing protein n=1 Tax=Romanomermis culicivorax TaxID=13658 RepID=A0A915L7T3_ROMCU